MCINIYSSHDTDFMLPGLLRCAGMLPRKRSNDDDDDDFVNPPPRHIPIPVQIQAERFPCLNTKFPPEQLIQTMELLKEEQRKCVVAMGFGAALTMRLGKLPRMFSFWLVDNYNPNNNSIHVNGQTFVVTREAIRDIYGIPMGEISMSNPVKANHEDDVVSVWKSQFPPEVKRIRLTHVIDKILNDSVAGPLFRINFLVLYVSVMIGFPSMGTVNQSFLTNIKMGVDVSRLDWCGLVITCLNASRSMWNRLDVKCVFTGPVAFLLLFYLRFTKLKYASNDDTTHPLIHWTSDRLKQRELLEMEKGRFEKGQVDQIWLFDQLRDQFGQNMDSLVNHWEGNKGDYGQTWGVDPILSALGYLANCPILAIPVEMTQFGPILAIPGLLHTIEQTFTTYYKAKEDLDVLLEIGLKRFPESEEIRNRIRSRNFEFNLHLLNIPLDITHVMEDIPISNEQLQPADIEGKVDNSEYNDALICTPLTQLLTTEVFDILEESALKSRRTFVNNDTDENNADDEKLQTRRRSKRCVKFTDKLRSPNFNRVVDPSSSLKSIEARVSGMVFAGIGNEWYIHITVIDVWATILNYEEQRQNKKSPSRLFVSCTLLANYVFDEEICVEKRYKMFYKRMDEYLFKFHPHIDFQQIRLLYLDSVKHPKRSQMKAVHPTKFVMSWMTRENYTDCGIFVMRHKGQELQDWEVNLEDEDPDKDDQQLQLAALRRKYVTKMLTSDLNNLKPTVYSYLPKYDALPLEKKTEIYTKENFDRMHARSRYIVLPKITPVEDPPMHCPKLSGTTVEVMQNEEGLQGSYFAGVVIDRTPGMRKIKYETLLDDEGKPLEELISMRRLRPRPPKVDARMSIGDLVDAWDNDGWWVGTYTRRDGDNYIVKFQKYPDQEYSYARRDLRFHHQWTPVNDLNGQYANSWLLLKR
ncbi:hypothetical protein LXL04_015932 [Taraxacum kok-saghyz]